MWYEIIGGLLFFLPIIALYLEKSLFTVTNIAIVFAVEAIAISIFEVPSGAIADLFGRKKSFIAANILVLFAITFLFIGGNMMNFLIFAILNALGRSLVSGTESAMIYDSLKEENKEEHFKKVIGTMYALWPIGASLGSIVGGHLAKHSLSLPVLYSLIPIAICLIITFFLKEPEYHKEEHKNVLIHMKNSFKIIINNHQLIVLIIGGLFLLGIGESYHRLNSLYFVFKDIPIVYFGYISAIIFGLSSIGHYSANAVSEKYGNKRILIIATVATPILLLISTFTNHVVSIIFYVMVSLFFGLRRPVLEHLLNKEIGSSKRATVISINNFFGFIGMGFFSIILGFLSDKFNINNGFRISAMVLLIVPILFFGLKKDEK